MARFTIKGNQISKILKGIGAKNRAWEVYPNGEVIKGYRVAVLNNKLMVWGNDEDNMQTLDIDAPGVKFSIFIDATASRLFALIGKNTIEVSFDDEAGKLHLVETLDSGTAKMSIVVVSKNYPVIESDDVEPATEDAGSDESDDAEPVTLSKKARETKFAPSVSAVDSDVPYHWSEAGPYTITTLDKVMVFRFSAHAEDVANYVAHTGELVSLDWDYTPLRVYDIVRVYENPTRWVVIDIVLNEYNLVNYVLRSEDGQTSPYYGFSIVRDFDKSLDNSCVTMIQCSHHKNTGESLAHPEEDIMNNQQTTTTKLKFAHDRVSDALGLRGKARLSHTMAAAMLLLESRADDNGLIKSYKVYGKLNKSTLRALVRRGVLIESGEEFYIGWVIGQVDKAFKESAPSTETSENYIRTGVVVERKGVFVKIELTEEINRSFEVNKVDPYDKYQVGDYLKLTYDPIYPNQTHSCVLKKIEKIKPEASAPEETPAVADIEAPTPSDELESSDALDKYESELCECGFTLIPEHKLDALDYLETRYDINYTKWTLGRYWTVTSVHGAPLPRYEEPALKPFGYNDIADVMDGRLTNQFKITTDLFGGDVLATIPEVEEMLDRDAYDGWQLFVDDTRDGELRLYAECLDDDIEDTTPSRYSDWVAVDGGFCYMTIGRRA